MKRYLQLSRFIFVLALLAAPSVACASPSALARNREPGEALAQFLDLVVHLFSDSSQVPLCPSDGQCGDVERGDAVGSDSTDDLDIGHGWDPWG